MDEPNMVAPEDVLARRWTQYQFFGPLEDKPGLQLAGNIVRVAKGDFGRLALHGDIALRKWHDGWERLMRTDPFLVPGPIGGLVLEMTPLGRVVILSLHPKESTATVLFPEGDPGGEEELCRGVFFAPLDLATIAANARPEEVRSVVVPDDLWERILDLEDPELGGRHEVRFVAPLDDDDDIPF